MGKPNLGKDRIPTRIPGWDSWSYRLGCPVWGCKDWGGKVYPKGIASEHLLTWYTHSFPAVEGNSTFYSVPDAATFRRWRDQAAPGFQFSLKFPRSISHDRMLHGCDDLLREWMDRLNLLREADKLGPTFLQLGPSFSFQHFERLQRFIDQLPLEWAWALEVRHRDWFDEGEYEERLQTLLTERNIDQVLFDSRPLNSLAPSDATEHASQSRKPKSPFRATVTGKRPMVRLIGRNERDEVADYWDEWAHRVADWIRQGLQPWIFTHAPDDRFAPDLASDFHLRLRQLLPEHPDLPWPALEKPESEGLTQLELF
ncbi:DUF72 domain-containing protein [Pirellulaceae bacterium SH467]